MQRRNVLVAVIVAIATGSRYAYEFAQFLHKLMQWALVAKATNTELEELFASSDMFIQLSGNASS